MEKRKMKGTQIAYGIAVFVHCYQPEKQWWGSAGGSGGGKKHGPKCTNYEEQSSRKHTHARCRKVNGRIAHKCEKFTVVAVVIVSSAHTKRSGKDLTPNRKNAQSFSLYSFFGKLSLV